MAADTAALIRPRARAAITSDGFNYIRDLVHGQSAIVLEPGKEYLVESRLEPVARHRGFDSVQAMVDSMRSTRPGPLHRSVVEAMTNNETLFFRDPRVFSMLRSHILPALTARLRAGPLAEHLVCGLLHRSGAVQPRDVAPRSAIVCRLEDQSARERLLE